ncbi:MAG: valine--tRNA ligase [Acidimicrobiales bacterium]
MSDAPLPELAKAYVPAEAEPEIRSRWADADAFHAVPPAADDLRPRYSIVIPPPNVTAALHLGHALNNTLQDVLIRYHRMRGDATLWMPGTDHAGIATQTVVEKRLLAEGSSRLEIGREAFVDRTQEWKDEYEAIILEQLDRMGASVDTERTRFTMDPVCVTAVRHAFHQLFADGLIYRGKRLVNWDPVSRTALSDDEVESYDVAGHMWYLRYPLSDGSGHVVVATTRPETMLGDTAVAVNPRDPRADGLVGRTVTLPIVGRVIPIVADDYVVMPDPDGDAKARFATGFLKVTPAHDPNDWDIGIRHDLPVINILGPDGAVTDQSGWDDVSDEARAFIGLDRDDARVGVVDWFRDHDLLEKVADYTHAVGHSYRSHAPIEPWLSDQWFMAVTDDRFRGSAMRAQRPDEVPPLPDDVKPRGGTTGDGELRILPTRYARTYRQWHDGIRDWCISRQLWWGHRIPVWLRTVTHDAGAAPDLDPRWVEMGAAATVRPITDTETEYAVCVPPDSTLRRTTQVPEAELVAALEAAGFAQDPDVLDTWFSSGLWPLSTMGWPYPEDFPDTVGLLDAFVPTSVLTTAREIITLWVSRMVMFSRYFRDGTLPFDDVFIHAMIQDGHGQKMSKSLGNGIDPRDIITTHGADALRFALVQMTTETQDVRMPVDVICPHHPGESFTPEFVTSPSGHLVAAPVQTCPSDPSLAMVTSYGVASGSAQPTAARPLALNSSPKFDLGRNFANKVWNAARFAIRRLDGADRSGDDPGRTVAFDDLRFVDRWILVRLAETVAAIDTAIDRYQFNTVADALYSFVWNDVCDRYLEAIKPTVDDDTDQRIVLGAVLDAVLRLMHPVAPFVTEALWPHVAAARTGAVDGIGLAPSPLAAVAPWPVVTVDPETAGTVVPLFDRADALAGTIRTLRSSRNVKPRQQVTLHVTPAVAELIQATDGTVETLAGVGTVAVDDARPADASGFAFEGSELAISGLTDTVDLAAERARLDSTVAGLRKRISGFDAKLANPGYVNNAPEHLVAETRQLAEAARADLAAAEAALDNLDATV